MLGGRPGGTVTPGLGLTAVAVTAVRFSGPGMLARGARPRAGLVLLSGPGFAAGRVMFENGSGGEDGGRSDEWRGSDQPGHGKQQRGSLSGATWPGQPPAAARP